MSRSPRTSDLAALPALLLLAGCSASVSKARSNDSEVERPTNVASTEVKARPVPRYLALTGTLTANQTSQVAADGQGRVLRTLVERGSIVKQGELLVQLDTRGAKLSQSEARAQVGATQSQRDAAQRECERADKLLAGNAIGQAEHDRLVAQCSSTEWTSEAALARAELADKTLGDSAVRAPFAGMVVERFVSVGEYVRPGATVAALVEVDPLRLALSVPESEISRVSEGQDVSFEVSAFPSQVFRGKVARLSPSLRTGTRDLLIEAVVANPDHKLLPGMFALARIETERMAEPVIPLKSVRGAGGNARVFAVVNKRLEERLVQLGEHEGDAVAVLNGLQPGDRVASDGAATELRDGLLVE